MDIPYELNIYLFTFILPDISCDFKTFLNYRRVNRLFNKLILDNLLLNVYIEYLEVNKNQINNILKSQFEGSLKKDESYLNPFFNKNYSYHINKLKFLIKIHGNQDIYNRYDRDILDIFGYEFFTQLPVANLKCSKCLDNLCGKKCYNNNHNIENFIDNQNSVYRGIDDKNRPYVLIIYKHINSNTLIYEIIYQKNIIKNSITGYRNKNTIEYVLSYTGIFNNTYIGLLGINNPNFGRILNNRSLDYLERLIYNEPCGEVKYNKDTKQFIEDFNNPITIYF